MTNTRTAAVQDLRRSNAAGAIPSRKPSRRGGRRAAAITDAQRAHGH